MPTVMTTTDDADVVDNDSDDEQKVIRRSGKRLGEFGKEV